MAGRRLTVCTVWTGNKYAEFYPARFFEAVRRQLPYAELVCLTDRDEQLIGVHRIDVSALGLKGWWAKMALFDPAWRGDFGPAMFMDLDTVIAGDLKPLAELAMAQEYELQICKNFARARGVSAAAWPCRFGSCVMLFADHYGARVFNRFMGDAAGIMRRAGRWGDQHAIEQLIGEQAVPFLQDRLPGFFHQYRGSEADAGGPPPGAAVIVFGGRYKPHDAVHSWIKEAWNGQRRADGGGRSGAGTAGPA